MQFLFSGPNVEVIRGAVPLKNRPLVGIGSSAEIYEGNASVFRLSTGASSHCFVIEAERKGLAVPRSLGDWGAVLPADEYPEWNSYWLAEFEKLHPLEHRPDLHAAIRRWIHVVQSDAEVDGLVIGEENVTRLAHSLRSLMHKHDLRLLSETMIFMCELCLKYNADPDLDISNFMVREKTSEVLVIDPAHGAEIDGEMWNASSAWTA